MKSLIFIFMLMLSNTGVSSDADTRMQEAWGIPAPSRGGDDAVLLSSCANSAGETEVNTAGSNNCSGNNSEECRDRVAEEPSVRQGCEEAVMNYQANQSIVSADDIESVVAHVTPITNENMNREFCSDFLGENGTDKLEPSEIRDLSTFTLAASNDEHFLTLKGCEQVFEPRFFEKNQDLIQAISVKGAQSKKLCGAYGKSYCENSDFGSGCTALDFSLVDNQKKLAAMITPCLALQKANKNLSGLDKETDGERFNYVTVDYNGQGFAQGGFGCSKGMGEMALDYDSCKKAAHAFNSGFVFGDVAGEVAIQGYGAVKGADIQGDTSRESASPEPGASFSAQTEAQRRGHALARDQHIARAGINGAKGASMLGFMTGFITPKKVKNSWCGGDGGASSKRSERFTKAESCAITLMYIDSQSNDANQLDRYSMKSILFPNGNVTANLGQNAVGSLMKALVEGVMAKLQDDQAKMVGQVKEEFENANFNQPQTGIDMGELPTFCSENPTAPSCKNNNDNGSTGGAGIDVNFGSGISSTPNQIEFENGEDLTPAEQRALADAVDPVSDIPSLAGGTSDGKGNSDLSAIAPGSVSSSKRSGAGGGGGSAGGGGGGGGAGPGPGKKGGSSSTGALGKKVAGKYSSGSSRGYKSGGTAKKKVNSNPFNNLTGKGSTRSVASQTEKKLLPKNIRLFSAISKRYSEVSRSGRIENKN